MDFAKAVFDLETYKGCRVVWEGGDVVRCEGVRGTELTVIFRREISEQFKIVLCVQATMGGDFSLLHSGMAMTDAHIHFWHALVKIGSNERMRRTEELCQLACKIIEGNGIAEKARKAKK